jgi:hypothetical protein
MNGVTIRATDGAKNEAKMESKIEKNEAIKKGEQME